MIERFGQEDNVRHFFMHKHLLVRPFETFSTWLGSSIFNFLATTATLATTTNSNDARCSLATFFSTDWLNWTKLIELIRSLNRSSLLSWNLKSVASLTENDCCFFISVQGLTKKSCEANADWLLYFFRLIDSRSRRRWRVRQILENFQLLWTFQLRLVLFN